MDDDDASLSDLATLVADAGYIVETRSRFEDAKRALAAAPPDILVTDVRLGAYNGLQLALQMRDARPVSPIVVLSAFDDPMLRQQAANCSAQYLVKPVSANELLALIADPAGSAPH
ncbi:MAG: response regulator [Vicinamibacterales bacterium]